MSEIPNARIIGFGSAHCAGRPGVVAYSSVWSGSMSATQPNVSSVGLRHGPLMLLAPRSVFGRIAENSRYGWMLAALIACTTLIGWATVQTGLIDREIDRQTRKVLADLEREQIDLLSRTELSDRMEKVRQAADFQKLLERGSSVGLAPLRLVASVMVIAAVLFAIVALAGNKPDYQTLITICVYSAIIDVLAAGLRLGLMLAFRTIDVDTSLGVLVPWSAQTRVLKMILSGLDPFQAWFWILVALGLIVTDQLSRRAAIITCAVLGLLTAGVRMLPPPEAWAKMG
jgi:hypothetical protein